MGFKDAKKIFLTAIERDAVVHDYRHSDDKNWLARNLISSEQAVRILSQARGQDTPSPSPHHFLPGVDIWVFKPLYQNERWYVKGYCIDGELHLVELHLISFHPSERSGQ